MSTPNGYNNPAYCHQYDTSVYDYQYIPEIDPDSPSLDEESSRIRLVHPSSQNEFPESDEFQGSDESSGSIIVEECNNRRVTLICEKSNQSEVGRNGIYKTSYYHDVSLESENVFDEQRFGRPEKSLRHRMPLSPPVETPHNDRDTERTVSYHRPQRYHRYEEIPSSEDDHGKPSAVTSVHHYAEISPDENGYPSLSKTIEIQKTNENVPAQTMRIQGKPRAKSPPGSPPSTPGRHANLKTSYPKALEYSFNSPSHIVYSGSPIRKNSIEMVELSPPRSSAQDFAKAQTYFMSSPKRQPPIGAMAPDVYPPSGKCIIPSHLGSGMRVRKDRSHSVPNSPKRSREPTSTPVKSNFDRKIMQIFHVQSNPVRPKSVSRRKIYGEAEGHTVRRNISNSFTDPPATPRKKKPVEAFQSNGSPYKPTTTEIAQPKTAIITPIFQRKNQRHQDPGQRGLPAKTSFQSAINLSKVTDPTYPDVLDPKFRLQQERLISPVRLKRNQSVPNFAHTFSRESGAVTRHKAPDYSGNDSGKLSANLDFRQSPVKGFEPISPMSKSRLSLIDPMTSWSTFDGDVSSRCATCFMLATIVHLVTATATCAISFYLLSKLGRKYYLDFGLLAGFVNFIIGLLGFRSYCWRWLPNRNYVSGFVALAAFSALTCSGLSYLILVRPMAGDPALDVIGGAICAVSVVTIFIALTGLTMSGCCKTPPPDNRVNDV